MKKHCETCTCKEEPKPKREYVRANVREVACDAVRKGASGRSYSKCVKEHSHAGKHVDVWGAEW